MAHSALTGAVPIRVVAVASLRVLVAATTVAFWRHKPLAAALMLPYLVWVGFACTLTATVWRLNPGQLE